MQVFMMDAVVEMKPLTVLFGYHDTGYSVSSLLEELYIALRMSERSRKVYYLPAERAGILKVFEDLVNPSPQRLSRPTVEFLSDLHEAKALLSRRKESPDNPLLDELSKMLNGRIVVNPDARVVEFLPPDRKKPFPASFCSPAVLSLAPLWLFLQARGDLSNTTWFIDLPESHLHPSNQVKLADFFAKMIQSGATVVLSTNSDYLLSGINLCLKRFWVDKPNSVMLNPEQVCAYALAESDTKLAIKPIAIKKPDGVGFDVFFPTSEKLVAEEEELDIAIKAQEMLKEEGEQRKSTRKACRR